jgi:hypothetical protein
MPENKELPSSKGQQGKLFWSAVILSTVAFAFALYVGYETLTNHYLSQALLGRLRNIESTLAVSHGVDSTSATKLSQSIEALSSYSAVKATGAVLQTAALLVSSLAVIFVIVNIFLTLYTRADFNDRWNSFKQENDERLARCLDEHATQLATFQKDWDRFRAEINTLEDKVRKTATKALDQLVERKNSYQQQLLDTVRLSGRFLAYSMGSVSPTLDAFEFERLLNLFSPDKALCLDAVWFFSERGGPAVLPYLERITRDPEADSELRTEALKAIQTIQKRVPKPTV